MMMNMFSIFDPTTSWLLPPNWITFIMLLWLAPRHMWMTSSRLTMAIYLISNLLFKEFKTLIKSSHSNLIMFISLFLIILSNNIMGLFPHIFTPTSHLSFTLSFSLSLWMGMFTFSIIKYTNDLMSHLTPQGTPTTLMPLMVIIETTSLLIRPITLAVRLAANMIAGHLLLSLLGSTGPLLSPLTLLPMMSILNLLMALEVSVSMIQAYVISILSTLYSSEI